MRFKDKYLEEKHEPFDHHTVERQNDFTVGIAVSRKKVMMTGDIADILAKNIVNLAEHKIPIKYLSL